MIMMRSLKYHYGDTVKIISILCISAHCLLGLISLAFKSFQAQFLQRPETDVYFVCTQGRIVQQMIQETCISKERVTRPIEINAYTDYPQNQKLVATFTLDLSLKAK